MTNAHSVIWDLFDCLYRKHSLATKKVVFIQTGAHESAAKNMKLDDKLKFIVKD